MIVCLNLDSHLHLRQVLSGRLSPRTRSKTWPGVHMSPLLTLCCTALPNTLRPPTLSTLPHPFPSAPPRSRRPAWASGGHPRRLYTRPATLTSRISTKEAGKRRGEEEREEEDDEKEELKSQPAAKSLPAATLPDAQWHKLRGSRRGR